MACTGTVRTGPSVCPVCTVSWTFSPLSAARSGLDGRTVSGMNTVEPELPEPEPEAEPELELPEPDDPEPAGSPEPAGPDPGPPAPVAPEPAAPPAPAEPEPPPTSTTVPAGVTVVAVPRSVTVPV